MASLTGGKSQECHICLEELRQDLAACLCGHVFHHACILQALQVNTQCPICRRSVTEAHLINLYFDVPSDATASAAHSHHATAVTATADSGDAAASADSSHIKKLTDRVSALVERLQWQKKQYELLAAETKRVRHQSEQLVMDKQGLMHRIAALEANKSVLVSKVAKYQMELSRQAEVTRQMSLNQSIINFLNSCDADAMEEEIQNPRELIMALKKACKFRHDQYQKVVKEKTRLKAMLQNAVPLVPLPQQSGDGKAKLKAGFSSSSKRQYEYAVATAPHPLELKKRKPDSGSHTATSTAALEADAGHFTSKTESAGSRANAYSDVTVRPVTAARPTFARSNYNPNQYGAYNMTPATAPPVQTGTSEAICRRGYDETGKLTNFFLPKDAARGGALAVNSAGAQRKSVPTMQHMLAGSGTGANPRGTGGDRREFALTSWLRKDS